MALHRNINFNSEEILGSGSFGSVYRSKNGNQAYKKYDDYDNCFGHTFVSEVSFMKTLEDIPTVQKVDAIITKRNESGFFMKLYRTTVQSEVKQWKDYDVNKRINYAKHILYGLLVGLYYAHQRLIIHCDIKPNNIVINNEREMSIIDWGISIGDKYNDKNNWPTQTMWYRAPEVSLGDEHYDSKIDIWSAALVCYFILNGEHLLPGDSDIDQLYKIFTLLGTPTENTWPGVSSLKEYRKFPNYSPEGLPKTGDSVLDNLLSNMLILNPIYRFTAAQSLNHDFFADLRNDTFTDIPIYQRAMLVPSLPINNANINAKIRQEIFSVLINLFSNDIINISSFFLAIEYVDYILSQNNASSSTENNIIIAISCAYLAHMFNQIAEDTDDRYVLPLYIKQYPFINQSDICNLSYAIFRYLGYNLYRQHLGLYFNILASDIHDNLLKKQVLRLLSLFIQTPQYLSQDKLVVVAAAFYTLNPNIDLSYSLVSKGWTSEIIRLSTTYMSPLLQNIYLP